METLTVAFIGHRKVENGGEVVRRLEQTVRFLVEKKNAQTFLFGSKSAFDELSLSVVTELKEKYYPDIKRVYISSKDETIPEYYENYLLKVYDATFFPRAVKNAGARSYVVRNRAMIDKCNILVTYFNADYNPPSGKTSGTRIAVDYALKENKKIINLYSP